MKIAQLKSNYFLSQYSSLLPSLLYIFRYQVLHFVIPGHVSSKLNYRSCTCSFLLTTGILKLVTLLIDES